LLQNFKPCEQSLTRLTQPTLIIAGGSDRLLPSLEEAQRLVSLIPHAEMTVLPFSGHACLLETQTNLYAILEKHNFIENYSWRKKINL
jgi:pimeloyl-ACP methyl ester carboxylesterase